MLTLTLAASFQTTCTLCFPLGGRYFPTTRTGFRWPMSRELAVMISSRPDLSHAPADAISALPVGSCGTGRRYFSTNIKGGRKNDALHGNGRRPPHHTSHHIAQRGEKSRTERETSKPLADCTDDHNTRPQGQKINRHKKSTDTPHTHTKLRPISQNKADYLLVKPASF